MVPIEEIAAIRTVAREHGTAASEDRVTALAVRAPAAPRDLADQVASRLGLARGAVSLTPLALDGEEYVVAVWRGHAAGSGGLPALRDLAVELDGELLDGEVAED
jgi:hypothetical protein